MSLLECLDRHFGIVAEIAVNHAVVKALLLQCPLQITHIFAAVTHTAGSRYGNIGNRVIHSRLCSGNGSTLGRFFVKQCPDGGLPCRPVIHQVHCLLKLLHRQLGIVAVIAVNGGVIEANQGQGLLQTAHIFAIVPSVHGGRHGNVIHGGDTFHALNAGHIPIGKAQGMLAARSIDILLHHIAVQAVDGNAVKVSAGPVDQHLITVIEQRMIGAAGTGLGAEKHLVLIDGTHVGICQSLRNNRE